jgi:hypothetical protein
MNSAQIKSAPCPERLFERAAYHYRADINHIVVGDDTWTAEHMPLRPFGANKCDIAGNVKNADVARVAASRILGNLKVQTTSRAADHNCRRTPTQQNNSLKNEVGHNGAKAGNSADEKTAGFCGCLLVVIGNDAERAKKKGQHSALTLWVASVDHSSGVFALRRCSDLSLRPQASSTHAEKFAPGLSAFSRSMLLSISSTISCGNRMCFFADLLFTSPVAIGFSPSKLIGVNTPYSKTKMKKTIDVGSHQNVKWVHTSFLSMCKKQHPASVGSAGRVSNLNVIGANAMATPKCTQTRPEYTWLFLATRPDDKAAPTVLRTTAATEAEARADFPGWELTFAAKIRTESPFVYHFLDTDNLVQWSVMGTDAKPSLECLSGRRYA